MSGSYRYLSVLESLQELFTNCPTNAEMSSIQIAMDPSGQASIVVQLHNMDTVTLAAGIVEWVRTLAVGTTWVWRAPDGKEIYILTTGFMPECDEVPVGVMAGPIPPDCYLDFDLDSDAPEEIDSYLLDHWLGSEIMNNWPFEPTLNTRQAITVADA